MPSRVFIVDQSYYNRSVLRNILVTHGYTVCGESASGTEAVDNYEKIRPDVLIIAATLPSMDGVATIKTLRQKYPEAATMLSASAGQRSVVVEALTNGAIDFIAKPYSARRVIATMRKHFG